MLEQVPEKDAMEALTDAQTACLQHLAKETCSNQDPIETNALPSNVTSGLQGSLHQLTVQRAE
jgi:hypothetical protein